MDLQEGQTVGGVMLSQGSGKQRRLVALVGRDLTLQECSWTYPEQVLALACWGMRRLHRWTGFVPRVSIVLPQQHCLLLVKDKAVHARLRALVLELAMYGVAYRVEEQEASLLEGLKEAAEVAQDDDVAGVPQLEHKDTIIKRPTGKKMTAKGVDESAAMRIYFDGRSADKRGSGGFIAFAPDGSCLGGAAFNYGVEAGTVNAAEMESLARALTWAEQQEVQAPCIVIYGDSDLTVKFLNRQAQPRVQKLATRVALCTDIRKRMPVPTHVLYIPREKNQLADWLSKVGATVQQEVQLHELGVDLREDDPPPKRWNKLEDM